MNKIGISYYYNETSDKYLLAASKLKIETIFTSLHMPEKPLSKIEITEMLNKFLKSGFKTIIADISHKTFDLISLKELKKLNVKILRIDYGLNEEQIINLQNFGFSLAINASTVSQEEIDNLLKLGLKKEQTIFIHNFYPKIGTALTEQYVSEQNRLIYKNGFKQIWGFIEGTSVRRSPMYKGLPTLETMRGINEDESFEYSLSFFDNIIIGDSEGDLTLLKEILKEPKKEIKLQLEFKNKNVEKKYTWLLNKNFTIRRDSGKDFFRIKESREYASIGGEVLPDGTWKSKPWQLVIVNSKGKRYSGELLITKTKIDEKEHNLIGSIISKRENIFDKKIKFIKK